MLLNLSKSFEDTVVNSQRIQLKDIETLTFLKDKFTNGNRVSPIPQLKCIGSYSNCYNFSPDTVQCYNKGFDGLDVQVLMLFIYYATSYFINFWNIFSKWECKADLDKRIRFGVLKVICEGYSFPNDPYILNGSCGVSFTNNSK